VAARDARESRIRSPSVLSIRRIAMSKAQKGNKENRKPKANKNQSKANVSAYKAAQGQGKPASSRSRKRPGARFGLMAMRRQSLMRQKKFSILCLCR